MVYVVCAGGAQINVAMPATAVDEPMLAPLAVNATEPVKLISLHVAVNNTDSLKTGLVVFVARERVACANGVIVTVLLVIE